MTGLPNGLAFDEQLRQHKHTMPSSVLAVDFHGMRAANAAFKSYELGASSDQGGRPRFAGPGPRA